MNRGKDELNLWKSIWLKPRETVRYAIDHKPMKFAVILALIAGIFDLLNASTQNNFGDSISIPMIFVLAIILGPILGIIGWWISAGIATIVGTWLGGIGTFSELKMAFSVTYIPLILFGLLLIPNFLILGKVLFIEDFDISFGKTIWLFFSGFIGIVVGIWSFVIRINAIAEAHQFSAWRGFWTIFIPSAVIFIVLLLFLSPFIFFQFL